jgi:CRISPR-associated protein Cas1
VLKWDTVIEQKTVELGHYLAGRSRKLDLLRPSPVLTRIDSSALRQRILALSQSEAQRIGIGKSTLKNRVFTSRVRLSCPKLVDVNSS